LHLGRRIEMAHVSRSTPPRGACSAARRDTRTRASFIAYSQPFLQVYFFRSYPMPPTQGCQLTRSIHQETRSMAWTQGFWPTARRLSRRAARSVLSVEALEPRELPTATPFLVPTTPSVSTTAIITTGDNVGTYQMAGIPDGLGAFDNGDGTFT